MSKIKYLLALLIACIGLLSLFLLKKRSHEKPQHCAYDVKFTITEEGDMQGLSVLFKSSLPLVLGERVSTNDPQVSFETIFGGKQNDTPIGYQVKENSNLVAKVWIAYGQDNNTWSLNAQSQFRMNVRIVLDLIGPNYNIKHREWILIKGAGEVSLANGSRTACPSRTIHNGK